VLLRSPSDPLLLALLKQPELLLCEGDREAAWQRWAAGALLSPTTLEGLWRQVRARREPAERGALATKYIATLPMAAQVSGRACYHRCCHVAHGGGAEVAGLAPPRPALFSCRQQAVSSCEGER
jgi:hypothetical protein